MAPCQIGLHEVIMFNIHGHNGIKPIIFSYEEWFPNEYGYGFVALSNYMTNGSCFSSSFCICTETSSAFTTPGSLSPTKAKFSSIIDESSIS